LKLVELITCRRSKYRPIGSELSRGRDNNFRYPTARTRQTD